MLHNTASFNSGFPNTSYFGSYQQLPTGNDVVPDDQNLEDLTPEELRALINHLKNELTKSHDQAEQMMTHFSMLDNLRDIPGENNQDKETDQAKDPEVDKEEMKNLQSEIDVLKAHLKHTENLNNLLKKQLEINTDSKFDPELIVNMAEQIQKLENELEKARRNESAEEKTKDGATTTKKSAIPVRKDAKLPTGEDSDHSPLMNNFPKLTKQTGNEKGNFVLFRFSMNFVNFRIGITAAW